MGAGVESPAVAMASRKDNHREAQLRATLCENHFEIFWWLPQARNIHRILPGFPKDKVRTFSARLLVTANRLPSTSITAFWTVVY